MHAQNEHSPPTKWSSTIATSRPCSARRPAATSPAGPAPITTTSKLVMDPHPSADYNERAQPRGRQASTWLVRGVGCESRYRSPRKTPENHKCEYEPRARG